MLDPPPGLPCRLWPHQACCCCRKGGGGGGVCKANGCAAWLRGPPADPEHELLGTLFGSCHVTPTSKSSRLGLTKRPGPSSCRVVHMDVLGPAFTSAGCEDLPLTTHCCLVGGWGAGLALEVPASIQVTAASPQNTSTMRPQKQLLLRTQGAAVGLEYWRHMSATTNRAIVVA